MRKLQSALAGILAALAVIAIGGAQAGMGDPRSSAPTRSRIVIPPPAPRAQSGWTQIVNPGPQPLKIFYKASTEDFVAVATPESETLLLSEGFQFVRTDGLVMPWRSSDTVALNLVRCQSWTNGQSRTSYATTTAPPSVHRCDVIREEGSVYIHPAPDRMELIAYWNGVKGESALGAFLAAETLYRNASLAPGKIEGFVPRTDPDSAWRQQRSFWDPIAEDNLTAAGPGLTGITGYGQAIRSGLHAYVRDEGFVATSPAAGMTPLYAYFRQHQRSNGSTRRDYFLGATPQAAADAAALGYAVITIDGFCHTTQQPGAVPLKRYWHAGRGDYFTLASSASEASAVAAGYQYVGTECYVPLARPAETLMLRPLGPRQTRPLPRRSLPTAPSPVPLPSTKPPM
ncbi:MAG: peptidase M23B [Alphaproteobacteria bacterium]|nr:MAG: peptidase M23B [Caulobacteraceae bacterium]TPW07671.1 MAG: peptidase M23B [Alphaproteobacteria bacterium]